MTRFSLYLEFKAKPGKEKALAAFLSGAQRLAVAETGTVAWFAVQFDSNTFAIFDAFNDEESRTAHVSGEIAKALMAHADELLVAVPAIRRANVLADKLPA